MIMDAIIRKLLSITALMILSLSANGQVKRDKIIGQYIYNFANNISWPKDNSSAINLILLSSEPEVIKEIKSVLKNQKIKGKTIDLIVMQKPEKTITDAHLIFIAKDKVAYYLEVFDLIEGKPVLLVSDSYKNKNYVMLNLFDTENETLKFEINKNNILNQNLKLSDELLLMGGSEIDAAKIYYKSQQSLRNMEKEINRFNQELKSLSMEIAQSNLKVEKQKAVIDSQKVIQARQALKILADRQLAEQQLQRIAIMRDSLKASDQELKNQQSEILASRQILEQQLTNIDEINKQILLKNKELKDQGTIIGEQEKRMQLFYVIIALIILLIFITLLAYRQKRKQHQELNSQKSKVDTINKQLTDKNEELNASLEEIKRMQQEMIHNEKMASLGLLTAGIAHEINNPINFVYAGINSLLRDFKDIEPIIKKVSDIKIDDDNLEEKLRQVEALKKELEFDEAFDAIPHIINDIQLGADRTAEIVKGLRNFSQTDQKTRMPVIIHEGLDTALLLLKSKYKNHITIEKKYGKDIPVIDGFEGKLNQVFTNILSNAIDAIETKGTIRITTKADPNMVTISVKDDGCGMSQAVIDKIFDPFFTTKPVGQGTGLGLSISYGIIQEHGGTIEVRSKKEEGTEFIIKLPHNTKHPMS